jgi:hypothetical protein
LHCYTIRELNAIKRGIKIKFFVVIAFPIYHWVELIERMNSVKAIVSASMSPCGRIRGKFDSAPFIL